MNDLAKVFMNFSLATLLCILCVLGITENVEGVKKDAKGDHASSVKYFSVSSHDKISLFMSDVLNVTMNYPLPCGRSDRYFNVSLSSTDHEVFEIHGNASFLISCSNSFKRVTNFSALFSQGYTEYTQGDFGVSIKGKLLGLANLNVRAIPDGSSDVIIQEEFDIHVLRTIRMVDSAFRFTFAAFFFLLFIGFGCKIDIDVVKECLKKPIAPGIGLACQYLLMPLIGYGVATIMPIEDKSIRLGIFLCGVCPGGGLSNVYTLLLGGDISLSITMTFISNISSTAFMPLWIYTLGRTLMDENINLTIPILPLIQAIALVSVPVLVGVLIKCKLSRVATIILKILKPATAVCVVLFFVIGIISNLYLLKLFKLVDFLAGCLLPYMGYLLGGCIAAFSRQPWARIKTISIEAGMQNIAIAFVLLIFAFPPPLGDIATIAPAANGLMTPIPGLLIAIPYNIYRKRQKRYMAGKTGDSKNHWNGNLDLDNGNVEKEKLSTVQNIVL